MRRKLVAGNWKMHTTRASADALVRAIAATPVDGADVAVFPPYVYLAELIAQYRSGAVAFGAQDVSEHAQGAFTGEVAAGMLRDIGATHVLVGHSERRQYHGESSARVAAKFAQAQAVGLIPVLCVGETLDQRDAGATEAVVGEQLDAVVKHSGIAALATAVVALDAGHIVRYANQAAENLLGTGARSLIGQRFPALFTDNAALEVMLAEALG